MSVTHEEWLARARSFGKAAANYASGRPSYPVEAVRWGLRWDDNQAPPRVLDLAAGTGKLTSTLLALGCDVVAVEPLDDMRELISAPAIALAGTAEQIPLEDASVDAVVVGQAWHWFEPIAATAEVARVLRPGGRLAVMWNLYATGHVLAEQFAASMNALTSSEDGIERNVPWPDGSGIVAAEFATFAGTELYDADRLVAYASSHSWVINAEPAERERVLADVRAIAPAGEFELHEDCTVWRGVRPT